MGIQETLMLLLSYNFVLIQNENYERTPYEHYVSTVHGTKNIHVMVLKSLLFLVSNSEQSVVISLIGN